jgi:hypothetical protein
MDVAREVIAGEGFDVLSEQKSSKAVISSTLETVEDPFTGYFLVELFQLPSDLPE